MLIDDVLRSSPVSLSSGDVGTEPLGRLEPDVGRVDDHDVAGVKSLAHDRAARPIGPAPTIDDGVTRAARGR